MGEDGLDLDGVAAFVQVVESGGFSAAARALQVPKSSVSRRVARLERDLDAQLLRRTTRSVALTELGAAFHQRAASALAELRDAARTAVDAREVPSGLVRLAAPADLGTEVLPRLLARFLDRYGDVRVEIEFGPDLPTLMDGGWDLALRVGLRTDPALAGVKLQDLAFRLYAAAGYLDRVGAPRTVGDLADHACVLYRPDRGVNRWRLHEDGQVGEVAVTGPVGANDMSFVRRAAVEGAGIALLPELVGEQAVARDQLRPVLPGCFADGLPLYLVHPASAYLPLRVRVLRDFLLANFPRSAARAS